MDEQQLLRSVEAAQAMTPTQQFEDFEILLVRALGAAVGGAALTRALGYPSQEAFRKAHQRGILPVPTFELAGRRGRFAATTDIAVWLWEQKQTASSAPLSP